MGEILDSNDLPLEFEIRIQTHRREGVRNDNAEIANSP